MDAKILRAAVSAAIRVTVSTTVIGCGGNVTSDAGGSAGAAHAPSSVGGSSNGKSTAGKTKTATPIPRPEPASGGTGGGAEPATGGAWALGGQPTGGTASAGSAAQSEGGTSDGGEPNTAGGGAGPSLCACTALLANVKTGDTLSDDAKLCCQTAIDGFLSPEAEDQACWADLQWFSSPAHQLCCTVDTWQHPACTPWGPAVPPELPLAALLEWEAAA